MSYKPVLPPPMGLIELESIGSTNDHAKQLARNGYPSGAIVWAHEQTAGRGRQGNSWVSNRGNLFMTVLVRPKVGATRIGQLALLAGVALGEALAALAPAADIRLKWPNDVFIGGQKAAGILVETESQGAQHVPWAVVGIGVNVAHAPENATSLHAHGAAVETGQVLEAIAVSLQRLTALWEAEGFVPIRQKWLDRAWRLGERISARLPKETLSGIFEDLDETGALLLTLQNGERRVINTGEVFA